MIKASDSRSTRLASPVAWLVAVAAAVTATDAGRTELRRGELDPPAAEGQRDPDRAHVQRVGEQRSRHRVHDRQLGLDAAGAGQPGAQLPGLHRRAREPARGPAQRAHRRGLVGPGRGALRRAPTSRAARAGRRRRHLPGVAARRPEPATSVTRSRRRTSSSTAAEAELRAATSRTRCRASPRWARGGCGFEHQIASVLAGAGRRRRRRRRDERRLPARRRAAGDRAHHRRGRLLGAGRHRSVRPDPDAGRPIRWARSTATAATSSGTCATACRRRARWRR